MKKRNTLVAFIDKLTAPRRAETDLSSPVELREYRLAVDVPSVHEVVWRDVLLPRISYEAIQQALKDYSGGHVEKARAEASEYLRDPGIRALMEEYASVEEQLEANSASVDEARRLRGRFAANLIRTEVQLLAALTHLSHRMKQRDLREELRFAYEDVTKLREEVVGRRRTSQGGTGIARETP